MAATSSRCSTRSGRRRWRRSSRARRRRPPASSACEPWPPTALSALMDGYEVLTAAQAAPWGEVFITATGNINVFRREHFTAMRDGAILANSGHFDAELDLVAL